MISLFNETHYDIQVVVAESWMWETDAYPEEEAHITRAVTKRKREFRAGRHAARKALAELGHEHFPIKVGNHRQPLWPEGVVGSISHTDGYCVCAASGDDSIDAIGIDVELATPVDTSSLPIICSRNEIALIQLLQPQIQVPLCKLIFSAKECVHKAYYPLNEHTLDFLDAEIRLDLDKQSFEARITNPETNPKHPISLLTGRFAFDDTHLFTALIKEHSP